MPQRTQLARLLTQLSLFEARWHWGLVPVALSALLLPGCATVQPSAQAASGATAEQLASEAAEDDTASADDKLPSLPLTPDIMYKMMLGDVAASRDNLPLAVSAYLQLSRETGDPRIIRRAVELAVRARDTESAIQAAQLWVQVDANSQQANQMLASALLGAGRVGEAEPYLTRLLASDVVRRPALLMQISRMASAGPRGADRSAQAALVDRLSAPYLDLPEARFARAQANIAANRIPQALNELQAALQLKRDWESVALFKSQLEQAQGSNASALQTLQQFLAANPAASQARLQYARLLTSERRYDQAREEFLKVLRANPENPDVIYAVALLSIELKQYDDARELLERLLSTTFRDRDQVFLYLGQIEEQQKKLPQALTWYREIGAGERYLPAQLRIAAILVQQGKLDDGVNHLQSIANASPPLRNKALMAQAQLLRESGEPARAFDVLEKELAASPQDPDLLYDTALQAERMGKPEIMERHLRKLMILRPDSAQAFNALGYSFAERGVKLDEARTLIEKALKITPDDPFIIDSLGWVLFKQGDTAGALSQLTRAFNLRADPEIAAHLGEVLWAVGRRDEALKTWRDAQRDSPENEALTKTIQRFQP